MYVELDSLRLAQQLKTQGFTGEQAEGLVSEMMQTKINNLYSKEDIDTMIPETVQKIFDKYDRLDELRQKERERVDSEFEKSRTEYRAELRAESRTNLRWIISTIITVGFALATYLSIVVHLAINK